jgi:sugar phosphate isomerase/epimerase
MRFGIMAMQMDYLIPAELPREGPLAFLSQFDPVEPVRRLAEGGFDLIEIGGDMAVFFPHAFAPPAVEGLAALKEEQGLSYTVHVPLWSVEPSTPLAPVRQGSVQAAIDMIRATMPLEPEAYVFHATGSLAAEFYQMDLPAQAHGLIMRLFQYQAGESLKTILAETGLPSRRLAIETIEFPLDLTLELAEALDLSICFDTGHVLAGFCGPVDFFDALERCLPRLADLHLHDCPRWQPGQPLPYGRDHQPLGSGDLDTGRLLDRLDEAGFEGPVIFELRVQETLASLEVVRRLRPALLGEK